VLWPRKFSVSKCERRIEIDYSIFHIILGSQILQNLIDLLIVESGNCQWWSGSWAFQGWSTWVKCSIRGGGRGRLVACMYDILTNHDV
jgi:hypothetical protein